MTLPLQDPMLSAEGQGQPSHRTGFFRTVLKERKAAVIGLSIIVFFVVLAIVAPYIAPYSVTEPSCAVYAPPSIHHWLGCDDGGFDMVSLLMVGGRISMIVGFAATLVAMIIGGGVGILSGYFGGWVDSSLMRVTDYLLVIPDLVFMMVIADLWGDQARYRLLETIRQYAAEQLDVSGERDAIRERHLQFFVSLAEGAELEHLEVRRPTLEDVYLELVDEESQE